MLHTVEAVISNGVITPTEPVELVEGSRALITILGDDDDNFWLGASESSLNEIWNNTEDDVYAERFSRNEIVLVRFPFSDLSHSKVRPAVVVSGSHSSKDLFLVPLLRQSCDNYLNMLASCSANSSAAIFKKSA